MPSDPAFQSRSRAALVDQRLITALSRAFGAHAGPDRMIDAEDLRKALGLRSEYLAKRLLRRFDRDGDGVVRRDDFLDGVQRLVLGSDADKLRFAFQLHDHDDDGSIDLTELDRMITLALAESGIEPRRASAPSLARALLAEADTDRDGRLSLAEFEAVVRKHPQILERMTRSEALWIVPSEDLLARLTPKGTQPLSVRLRRALANRWRSVVVIGVWLAASTVAFGFGWQSSPGDALVALGNGAGRALSLNAAIALLPVLRRLTTRLRRAGAGRVLPLDEALDFHGLVGHAAFGLALVHAGALTASYHLGHASGSMAALLTTLRGATGLVLVVAFLSLWLFALEIVRRSKRFELFYFSHLLYVVILAGSAVHEPRFLLFGLVPIALLVLEHVGRALRRGYATVVHEAHALRSGVTELRIEKPAGFSFSPGDYVFLRLPAIAKREWHPFTISSPPESADLTFHVRSLGNWSGSLRERIETRERESRPTPMVAFVDGPYGSPTAHLFRSRYAVLIGAGIGVTPFASVLASLVERAGTEDAAQLTKGHFFWVNRDQYSFEWFTELLGEVERKDRGGLFDLHLFLTGAKAGASATALEAAREITHQAGEPDVVTGLRTFTHFGPPDWKAELATIRDAHAPEPVDVFFCGPPGLGAILDKACRELGMRYREERF